MDDGVLEDRIARLVAAADGMDDGELEAQIAVLVATSENDGIEVHTAVKKAKKKMKKKERKSPKKKNEKESLTAAKRADDGEKKRRKKKKSKPKAKPRATEENLLECRVGVDDATHSSDKQQLSCEIPSLEQLGHMIEVMSPRLATPTSSAQYSASGTSTPATPTTTATAANTWCINAEGKVERIDKSMDVKSPRATAPAAKPGVANSGSGSAKKEVDMNNEFGWIQSVVEETVVASSPRIGRTNSKRMCTDAEGEGKQQIIHKPVDVQSPRKKSDASSRDKESRQEEDVKSPMSNRRNRESREEDDSMIVCNATGKDDGKRDDDDFMTYSEKGGNNSFVEAADKDIRGEEREDGSLGSLDEKKRGCDSNSVAHNSDGSNKSSDGGYDGTWSFSDTRISDSDERDDDSVAFNVNEDDGSIHDAEPGTLDTSVIEQCDIIILGAGAAGIGAARTLLAADATLKVIVIEARNRVGGRACTSDELGSGVALDHGARLAPRRDGEALPKGFDLDATFDAILDSDDEEDDDDVSSNSGDKSKKTIRHDPNRKYRMMWNTEGYLERVRVRGTKMSRATSRQHTVDLSNIHQQASSFMYRELCRFLGPESQLDKIRERLPREATYKDCLDELASREKEGQTFEDWMYSRAESVLQFLMQRDGVELLPQPYDVLQVIATLELKLYHFYEEHERTKWSGLLDKLTCSKKNAGRGTDATLRGYGQLLEMLATQVPSSNNGSSNTLDVRYNQQAVSVFQTPEGAMEVSTIGRQDREYIARVGCICAIPLGVLRQQKKLVFDPPLPDELTSSMKRLSTFHMNKIEILFPARWWPVGCGSLDLTSHALDTDKEKSDFQHCDIPWARWIIESDEPAIIVCYATHDFAERVETLTNDEVQIQATEALRSSFVYRHSNIPSIPDPVCTYCTRWKSDPHSRGAWTVAPAGVEGMKDVSAFREFNQEDDGNLFFAGEHTCDASASGLDMGTVHGAYISGVHAASELLRQKNRVKVYPSILSEE